jgi:putative chitinase
MASNSQKYFNNITPTKKNTISLIINACKSKGITNPIFQSALCSIVSKESDFVPKGEGSYATTSAKRIRSIFGSRFKSYTDAQIDVIKKDQKQFFSIVYGDRYGNGLPPTEDGWKFRGRGFNQLTFRGNYKKIGSNIGLDLNTNPELMEGLDIASKALVQFYIDNFSSMKSSVFSQYGVTKGNNSVDTMNSVKDIATAVRIIYQATAGPGKEEGGKPVALHYEEGMFTGGDGDMVFPKDNIGGFTKARNRAPLFYKLITGGSLPPNPNVPPAVVTSPTPDGPISVTASAPNSTNNSSVEPSEPIAQDSGNTSDDPEGNTTPVDQVVPGLSNVFPPTIKVEPIKFEHKNDSEKYIKEWSSTVGVRPFIWYNSYQIDDGDIEYFALYNDGVLPALTLTFRDTQNLMRDKGFPLDDTKIKIFLSSRTKNIKHILLEFKIKNFSIDGETLTIIGVLNVNGIHLRKFKSYSQKTSFFTLQDICKEVGLGFNSNISDSNDKMTWLNTGMKVYDFMDEILSYSYVSDEGFSYGYVDFYYNFNYVDIEKELSRDNSEDKGVDSSGMGINITGDSDRISRISLGNDRSFKESDSYVSEYKILNNSTSISLEKGYLNISKYYDTIKKEYLIFDVDSITSEGSKTIIMKASPQDTDFYKENVNTTYVGKLDPDNTHINYNYSYVHNLQNIDDLQKIGLKLTLPSPNYNLYRFQKVKVLITNEGASPASRLKNDRISGEWFITDIKFVYTQGEYKQELSLIKRELDVSDEELANEQTPASGENNTEQPLNNPVENTTNPTDLTNTDAPVVTESPLKQGSTQSQPTVVPKKESVPLKGGKLLTQSGNNKYVGVPNRGIAGHRLVRIIDELSTYLKSQGFDTKLGNNGVSRDLAASLAGGGARAKGSLHGSGLAIDLLFGNKKDNYYVKDKNGNKIKWLSIGDNKNLADNIELSKAIWRWVKTQDDVTWGGEWGKSDVENGIIKGHGIVEYHHFEIKKSFISNYWSPYKDELANLGFDTKLDSTAKLSDLYTKLNGTA